MSRIRVIEKGAEKTPITVTLSGEEWQALGFFAAAGAAALKTFGRDDDAIMNALSQNRPLYERAREAIQTHITAANLRVRAQSTGAGEAA